MVVAYFMSAAEVEDALRSCTEVKVSRYFFTWERHAFKLFFLGKWQKQNAKWHISEKCIVNHLIMIIDRLMCSNQFYLYSPKSQSHCRSGLYNLYSEQHPLSLDLRFDWGRTSHVDGEKKPFNRVKKNDGRNLWKSHRGGIPLPGRTDMQ